MIILNVLIFCIQGCLDDEATFRSESSMGYAYEPTLTGLKTFFVFSDLHANN